MHCVEILRKNEERYELLFHSFLATLRSPLSSQDAFGGFTILWSVSGMYAKYKTTGDCIGRVNSISRLLPPVDYYGKYVLCQRQPLIAEASLGIRALSGVE